MAQQTVTLIEADRKSDKEGKKDWFFYVFKDAGGNKWQTGFYDALGTKLADSLHQSVTLTYHEEQRGDFTNNVIDAFEANGAITHVRHGGEVVTDPLVVGETSVNADGKDERIARAVALKAAVDLAANGVLDPNPEGIIEVAQHFAGYLLTGQVAETADTRI